MLFMQKSDFISEFFAKSFHISPKKSNFASVFERNKYLFKYFILIKNGKKSFAN